MSLEQHLAKVEDVADKTFDFVIIGGGLAGCVLAARLTENPGVSVAVLEAGKAHLNDPLVTVPDGWMRQAYNPEYDWVFRTKPQARIQNGITTPDGKPDPSFYWSRGKGLGGSSSINFLFWTRPSREEVDAVEKVGNPGWNWERFFEAAKKCETLVKTPITNHPDYKDLYDSKYVGHAGPVTISFARTVSGAEHRFQQALQAFGVPVIDDALGGNLNGTFKCPNNVDTRTGTRSTAATGYLYPALTRPNLTVLPEAYVTRIITSKEGEEAVAKGVEFKHGGKTYTVNVGKEVIVSASTVKSPHILELSGIGNRKILEKLDIPVQVDLPTVGENLQDHLILANPVWALKSDQDLVTSDTLLKPEVQSKLKSIYGEELSGGPLYFALSGCTFLPVQTFSDRADEIIASFEKKLAERADKLPVGLKEQYEVQLEMLKDKNVPDIEIVVFPVNMQPGSGAPPFAGLLPSIGRPFTRGTIHAISKDPEVQPEIDPNYIEEEIDLELLVDSLKFVRKVAAQEEWKSITEGEMLPGPNVVSDEQIRENIKQNVSTTWHACGTCSMMPREKGGVVDTHLKVYGTKNIRVADLSILPLLTSVHTQATTYGIAEQAADIIKADHGL
ncbi:GMC oxidoreductase [Lentinus brumalis]|uniref:GMC oxidoreductase n=1 Tax=Lentinus brumalis TaxID=2498619 RepID=A0A371CR46_9APHY|nr:GMC oxidoreductase [Polyporus brumalis]